MAEIFSVSELTEQIRHGLESRFPFVWVRGEITDLSRPHSGHIYFSLKDNRSLLQCVWFSGKQEGGAGQKFDPLTGEIFETPRAPVHQTLKEGQKILCAGSIGVYAPRGQYQLRIEFAQAAGAGDLALEFEKRKAALAARGFFALERKRPLPENPRKVVVITSPHGAAIHDFIRLSTTRGISAKFRLMPVPVQGNEAAPKIAQAIKLANQAGWGEVIVIIRGGGSAEDLWAFNEEIVAEAILNSRVPVLAGIGHEVDFTLADLTADVRAATPSHAMQLLLPPRHELEQKLDHLQLNMKRIAGKKIAEAENRLAHRLAELNFLSPRLKLQRGMQRLLNLEKLLRMNMRHSYEAKSVKLSAVSESIKNCSFFLGVLARNEQRLNWQAALLPKLILRVLVRRSEKLLFLSSSLKKNAAFLLDRKKNDLGAFDIRLYAGNPELPLKKGYALLYNPKGIIHSVAECVSGGKFHARLFDGTLNATIDSIEKNKRSKDEY